MKSLKPLKKVSNNLGRKPVVPNEMIINDELVAAGFDNHQAYIDQKSGKIFCTCEDFKYTFYPALVSAKKVLKTIKIEEGKNTGRKRHIEDCGMCKHLLGTYKRLLSITKLLDSI